MIYYLRHNQIDKQKWDACIDASENGVIAVLSWFLDIVSPNWQAFVETDGQRYITVMPLTASTKMTFARLASPHYCQQLGIITTRTGGVGTALAEQFLKITAKHFRFIHNYKFLTENTQELSPLLEAYSLLPQYTRYLPLNRPYPEIYKGYNRDRKMNLKRAKRAGLTMAESEDIEPMITFFKEHVAHKVTGGVSETAYQMLRDLFREMRARNQGNLYYTSKDGKLNAGCLFARYNGKISYTFNAADEFGRVSNGRTLMIDEIIRQHAGTDAIFDFESPDIEAIEQFYASFGSEKMLYYSLYHNNLPLPVRLIRNLRMLVYRTLNPPKDAAEQQ